MSRLNADWQRTFVDEWLSAWNKKDLEKILSFYQDSFAMSSTFVCESLEIGKVLCIGKKEFEIFCKYIFNNYPEYVIRLVASSFKGESLTLHYYDCLSRLVTETMQFSFDGKIKNSIVYY